MDNKLLAKKNVLITGAGQNIGRSIALEMAKEGANIFFTDICGTRSCQLEKELENYPGNHKGIVSSIQKEEDIHALCKYLTRDNIKIDILVNNVGIQYETTSLDDFSIKEWHDTYAANVFGPMILTKNISQMMKKHSIHGSIIFLTSIHQWEVVRWPSYSSSKAALGMIIEELAVELSRHKIRVNGIAPGWVAKDEKGHLFEEKYSLLHKSSIDPCYIGRTAVYLASDYFSLFTTGTIIKIDGGTSLYNNRVDQTSSHKEE